MKDFIQFYKKGEYAICIILLSIIIYVIIMIIVKYSTCASLSASSRNILCP
eukprot:GAHX01006220.1.p1 GENE.GAHX01006220.1~~GAHX01006220.1.p1  ORF type:complete len:60 (-),score=1.19 GAHX01006220.1:22-174(-)